MRNFFEADEFRLVKSGRDFFETLHNIIRESKTRLHIQTYIFDTDETGIEVAKLIKEAALRGVEVFLLLDAFGSKSFSKEVKLQLISAGVNFRFFSPPLSSENLHLGRRLHHKIVVADEHTALIGGINIANKYNDNAEGDTWLDFAVLTRGMLNEYVHLLCEQFYFKRRFNRVRAWEKANIDTLKIKSGDLRYNSNDWFRNKNAIHKSYLQALKNSKNSIVMVVAYFLPGSAIRKLLQQASNRGVRIKLIVAGRSDLASVKLAELYLYDFYLKQNIEIYEWQKSVMHGKAMVVDGNWATIGSYNLNFLSHYASVELNVETKNQVFTTSFEKELEFIMQYNCEKLDLEKYNISNTLSQRFKRWFFYTFFRVIKTFLIFNKKKA